jgi:hypothetical protein
MKRISSDYQPSIADINSQNPLFELSLYSKTVFLHYSMYTIYTLPIVAFLSYNFFFKKKKYNSIFKIQFFFSSDSQLPKPNKSLV